MSAATAPGPARRLWARAGRKPLVVVAGLLVLAALVAVVAALVPVLAGTLPTGRRVALAPGDADAAAPSTRSWYDQATADGLAAELAAAVDGTDWCTGWRIVQLYSYGGPGSRGGSELVDEGSNLGADRPAGGCLLWARVVVLYGYTSSTSPREDNAALWVESSDHGLAARLARHPAFDVDADDLLREDLGRNESDVIGDAIAALPLALADEGRIDPLTVEPVAEEAPSGGGVEFADREGWGGSDVWRSERATILAGAVVALLGLAGLCLCAVPLRPRPQAVNPRRVLKAALAGGRPPTATPPDTSEETT